MTRLEGAVRWLDRQAETEEMELSIVDDDDQGRRLGLGDNGDQGEEVEPFIGDNDDQQGQMELGDDDDVDDGAGHADGREENALRAQCRRLEPQLAAVRHLCAERGLLPAATPRAASGATSPVETWATRTFGVRASPAAERAATSAAAASAAMPSAAAQEARDRRRRTGEYRWDGWTVFVLAIALAHSEDRQFLCRWTLETWGKAGGLSRSQMIELLCKMHQALLPSGRVGTTGPTGFQTASDVPSEWNGLGSYRLRADLRATIWALEGFFLRWAWW